MRTPYYCTECRAYHDRHVSKPVYFDETGACLSADDWRGMHFDEECQSEKAWEQYAREIIWNSSQETPTHKVFHNCGHMTYETHKQPMAWCRDCRERRSDERYNY